MALTGANGSGKSTLARLLVGMYEPECGTITVGNHNIKELELDCIRKHIVYVPQTPAILSGSIREGILFGSQWKKEDPVFMESVKGCFLDEMVRDNPFGYEWILTENGTNISGGHRQSVKYREPTNLVFSREIGSFCMLLELKRYYFNF